MKSFIVVALLVAAAVAVPVDPKSAVIVRQDIDNIGVDGYSYNVETSDSKYHSESGQLKNVGLENEAIEVRGAYGYVGTDGVEYKVDYVANEFGFQPQGDHLPKVQA